MGMQVYMNTLWTHGADFYTRQFYSEYHFVVNPLA